MLYISSLDLLILHNYNFVPFDQQTLAIVKLFNTQTLTEFFKMEKIFTGRLYLLWEIGTSHFASVLFFPPVITLFFFCNRKKNCMQILFRSLWIKIPRGYWQINLKRTILFFTWSQSFICSPWLTNCLNKVKVHCGVPTVVSKTRFHTKATSLRVYLRLCIVC